MKSFVARNSHGSLFSNVVVKPCLYLMKNRSQAIVSWDMSFGFLECHTKMHSKHQSYEYVILASLIQHYHLFCYNAKYNYGILLCLQTGFNHLYQMIDDNSNGSEVDDHESKNINVLKSNFPLVGYITTNSCCLTLTKLMFVKRNTSQSAAVNILQALIKTNLIHSVSLHTLYILVTILRYEENAWTTVSISASWLQ